ncbi:Mitochondrial solute carrier [Paragonimus heterotremus]|uniref:Mitochondrial solute carrier n=1 Tax=Paragonimus heterotremus TaxID=100268 RepID=A0A8J4TG62_9TREM|nr:Mitochondrial solute carrier [Paragonimus heterotremus]
MRMDEMCKASCKLRLLVSTFGFVSLLPHFHLPTVYIVFQAVHHRAPIESLRSVFLKYASVCSNGEHYMTAKDFVVHFLTLVDDRNVNESSITCIARSADKTKDGLISFDEFLALEALLCTPDALYALAFEIFDKTGSGYISFEDFEEVFLLTTPHKSIPFNFDCDFINLHFGKKKSRQINYHDFTQIIHDVNDEHAIQAFKRFDQSYTGTISATDFVKVMIILKNHLLTEFVRENLLVAALQGEQQEQVTFAYYMGFMNLLSNMEIVKRIHRIRSHGDQNMELTKGSPLLGVYLVQQFSLCGNPQAGSKEFINEAQHFAQITPMEISILFRLTSLLRSDERISYRELTAISPIQDGVMPHYNYASALQAGFCEAVQHKIEDRGRTVFLSVLEQCYRFALGSVAGAIGATAVYPIDLVKTRMQNQRTGSSVGELMYKNSWDCFRKVIRFEGLSGLYRGLLPQLVGVAPEKAIKLTVNDLVRDQFTSSTGGISLLAEMLAGGCAGASQVVFTNPLEIVKIRLQVAGEIVTTKRISAVTVMKDLGFFGLYKGARACFLRDIPFSAIYFTAYNNLKLAFADENGFNSASTLFAAATLAGAPAACLTTPADVIKTRLQVVARRGQSTYSGILDATRKIWLEEGGRAFWKGAGARVFRSSPQFGVTLLTYEMLQRFLFVDFGGRELSGSGATRPLSNALTNPDHIGGFRFATTTFTGIETKLGLCFPKYKPVA